MEDVDGAESSRDKGFGSAGHAEGLCKWGSIASRGYTWNDVESIRDLRNKLFGNPSNSCATNY
jgi:hypothetical protein